jgi:predicted TIM-barrel fold metal-dependent hydrolase
MPKSTTATAGAKVRERLSHPVIDADGHWVELAPIYFDYVREFGGAEAAETIRRGFGKQRTRPWYDAAPAERRRRRMTRPPFWGMPTNTRDRAAGMIPALFRKSLDDWGIDVAVVYPTIGLGLSREITDPELRGIAMRAYNLMAADLFRPYADRVIPVGVLALADPAEAIAQLEHAHSVGLKQLVTGGSIARTIEEDADWQAEARRRRVYIDGLGLDSPFDYDPVWRKFMDLKMAVTTHSGSMGWPDRNSPSSFVSNHLGHFAQSHHLFARSLFMGGVTQRFPALNFGFLEGGVGWACGLYADLMGHWEKRNRRFMHANLKPTLLDRAELRKLLATHTRGNPHFEGRIDDIIEHNLDSAEADLTPEESAARDMDSDEFAHVDIGGKADIERLFARNFYFGCEADDPMTAVAFDNRLRLKLKPVLGSDISHFDVIDATEVLAEAWELVEHGLIDEENFRDFTFRNAAHLFAGMNPDFFKGTILEEEVRKELAAPSDQSGSEHTRPLRGRPA